MRGLAGAVVRFAAGIALVLAVTAARAEAAQCWVSTTPVTFGTYNVFSASPADSTGTVTYRCTDNTIGVLITMTKGQSATFLPRELRKGTDKLSYNLFRDAARTSVWGDFSSGTSAHIDISPPKDTDIAVPVYGRIPAGQDISAGSYKDTVTLTMHF